MNIKGFIESVSCCLTRCERNSPIWTLGGSFTTYKKSQLYKKLKKKILNLLPFQIIPFQWVVQSSPGLVSSWSAPGCGRLLSEK